MSGRFNGVPLVVVSLVLAAPALAAPPEAAAPIAEEQLGGTLLTVVPQIAHQGALLRVAGPAGYALTKQVTDGAVTADLLVEAEPAADGRQDGLRPPSGAALGVLPDGRYHYEVIFLNGAGEQEVFTGLFFVEGGSLVSRDAKRAEIEAVREELARTPAARGGDGLQSVVAASLSENDFIFINDYAGDNETFLRFDNDSVGVPGSSYWDVADVTDQLQIREVVTYTETPRMTFLRGGGVGVGTTVPAMPFQVHVGTGPQLRLSSFYFLAGGKADLYTGVTGLWFVDDDDQNIVKFNHSAPENAFVVTGNNVGMGTATPATSLNLVRSNGTAKIQVEELSGTTAVRELFKLVNNGGPFFVFEDSSLAESWSFAMGAVGDFILSHQQTAGVEARLQPDGDLIIAGSLTQASSRTIKKEIELVEPAAVLAQVLELPIAEWSYRGDEQRARHLGPMAEDFHTAFGLGPNDGIAPSDTGGVALAAIQGLNSTLQQEVSDLRKRLARLEAGIEALTSEPDDAGGLADASGFCQPANSGVLALRGGAAANPRP